MTARRAMALIPLVATLVATSGCASANRALPRLARLVPDSVALVQGNVTEIEIQGAGFDASRESPFNTVTIGRLVLNSVRSSADGTRITLAVPDAVPSGGEAPPSAWNSGRYAVTVRTARGVSDTLFLTITVGREMKP